ncbi:MAG: SMP-30/gluconolactonase/LRE family protein [Hyphomicrobiales bacterium]
MKITPICDLKAALGEGPVWDHQAHALYWVDSLGPTLFRWDYATKQPEIWHLQGAEIGSLAVRQNGGLILAKDHGFYVFDVKTEALSMIAEPLAGMNGVRFNDGKVTPDGAFISGGMNIERGGRTKCPAFRLNADLSVDHILDGFYVFNGPCFNGAGDRLYFTGRTGPIELGTYVSGGSPCEIQVFYADGIHDGATIDAEDHIWSAQWSDGCVLRIAPDGVLERRIEIPDQVVTSVMFGGPELDIMFITTLGMDFRGVKVKSVDAGKTFMIEGLGIKGRPEPYFKG